MMRLAGDPMNRYGVLLLISLTIVFNCDRQDNATVLTVAGHTLSRERVLQRYVHSTEYRRNNSFTVELIREFIVKNYEEDMLLQAEAYNFSVDQESDVIRRIDEEKRNLLIKPNGMLYDYVLKDTITVSDAELNALYDRMDREVKFAHILLPTKTMADSILRMIGSGVSFEKLASVYSIDVSTKGTGGNIRNAVTPGMLRYELDAVMFNLKINDIAGPIRSIHGYHVIRLNESRDHHRKPFEQSNNLLKKRIEELKSQRFMDDYVRQLFPRYDVTLHDSLIDVIVDVYKRHELKRLDINDFPEEIRKGCLVEYDGSQCWTVEDFVKRYNDYTQVSYFPLLANIDVADFIDRQLRKEIMYLHAVDLKLDKDPYYIERSQHIKDYMVLQSHKQRLMNIDFQLKEDELRAFYESHKEFYKGEPFENLRERIKTDLSRIRVKSQFDARLKKLREHYKLHFNEQALTSLVDELNAMKAKQAS